ncbi:Carbonic anhydrase or acetyltransferase, isoleucine patch superfamily [Enhydrobacter aerosaccus]|uniref:Carbonic anhydrase or acetyltransferase, isoleucine patch superfamily n=1 Tax=Enhydrobacter aerosaccus TaxID=225324 RepID=A0A1T4LB06_9HYPH|nr:gamma carbonic anhydrase family protein [Enhydrobacter aerosaccus]SJZ51734.1 Carbonic anhydrase or acetyltransferase, isoleucine patch superfamily [Enhydrobacter aerosaccus]
MSGLIVPFNGFVPKIDSTAFIAPNATLIGEVEIGAHCGIWFGAVLRGDGPGIKIGDNSNIQDGTVIHVTARGRGTVVGRNVTVGHLALLHACEVQDDAFIGMHSTVLDNAVVESGAMVAAGAVVPPRKVVRRGELWAGNPAVKMRDLTEQDIEGFKRAAAHYVTLANAYRDGGKLKAAE